ncbi:unnamed protein product [Acanthoscelides obtectus]|uniref:PiggyBac transposable element-derived protein domain-containing protein n=1 Tax=Acanthoscelides obtectus TaxID=200917 RepID=A0A9P0KPM1_ACAOB|nr:unnamed protein product [Acanthoscelides obtectus]CAK1622111.1 PiggyBac transposable element-derived protein 4 [Acanthoscelides obtectus]
MGDRALTNKELEGIINNMSDCEYESDVDDSVGDPDFENFSSSESTDTNANVGAIDTPVDSEVNLSESSESSSDECSPNRDVSGSHEVRVIWNDCSDNETTDRTNRIYKIQPLADGLVTNFQAACIPKKDVCIDETMIPFRGRLSFRQYIPGKRHKYGVKIFKLCAEKGYTYNLKVYSGKEDNPTSQSVASRVVLELMEPLLDCGRLLCTDNFYASVSLAHELLDRKTHLIGTLRKNRKFNPKPITDAKLEKGDLIVRESNTHVIVGKWRDKRQVLFLTTEAVPEMTDVQTKRGVVKKPSTIAKYNSIKSFIDVSDQKASYSTTVRRGIKWYRKVAIEILTNTAVVNAHIAYQFFI